jgi:ATP-binding cassette subfamily B protein
MRTYRRLMGFLRPYRRQLWGSLVFAWAAMGMTVLIPWLIGRAVNAIENGDKPDLLPLAIAIVVAGILRLGLTMVRRVVAGKVSLAVEFDLRQRFYAHLQRLELGFFDGQQTGQLMSRATVDLQSIRFFLGYGLIFITQNLLTIALASAVMFALEPWLALVALAPAPFVVYAASRYNRVSRPAVQEVQQRIAELTAEAEENVSGIRIVKAFAREEHQLRRFRRAVSRVFDQSIYSTRLQAFYSPLLGFLPQLGIAPRAADRRPPGDRRRPQPRQLHRLLHLRRDAGGTNADAGDDAGDGPSERSPPATASSRSSTATRRSRARHRRRRCPVGGGRVEMRAVTLSYDGAAPALTDIDLEIEAGRTVALVGPSGSGKTSLVALIARLYDPSEGAVEIDGADVRSVDLASLRSQVAFVGDDSFLFTASIAENIAYARAACKPR